jgi:hypothetical protein
METLDPEGGASMIRNKSLRSFLGAVCTVFALAGPLLFAQVAQAQAPRKPNIIVIVGDDMGYADIGCHGCKDIATPHIDRSPRTVFASRAVMSRGLIVRRPGRGC